MAARLPRRKLLLGAGATAALAPFIPLRESEAQDAPRQRLVTWFTGNGTIHNQWTPEGTGRDFKLKRILAPLESHRERLLVLSGLDFNPQGPGSSHMQGAHLMFAGSRLNDGNFTGGGGQTAGWGSHISVDQVYAKAVGAQTPFESLVLAVRPTMPDMRQRISYAGDDRPLVPVLDPRELFDRVFSTAIEPDAQRVLRQKRKSVLDFVSSELTQLKPRYSARDLNKIDGHLESIRAIEKRISAAPAVCAAPDRPDQRDIESHGSALETGRLFMDLLVAVIACDQTRTMSLLWGGSTSRQKFPWLNIDEQHHTISHKDGESQVIEQLIKINIYYNEQLAYFMDRLAEIEEPGGSALDNTLIFHGNELGRGGAHSQTKIPIVLAGGAGGKLEMGRHLANNGALNNRLLVSVLNTLGMEEYRTFGNTDEGSGPLNDL